MTVSIRSIVQQEIFTALQDWEPQDFSEKLTVNTERFLVMSDMHLPKFHQDLFVKMIETLDKKHITHVFLLGDLMDMEEFSSYGVDDPTNLFRRNILLAGNMVKVIINRGVTVVWTLGNHEERFFRAVKYQLGMEDLARLAGLGEQLKHGTLIVHDNPTVHVPTGNWMLTHPKSYGSTPLVVPGLLATRFQMNVISAHAHHWGMGTNADGRFIVVESGGGFDPRLHKYIQHQVTTHRSWVPGFVTVEGTDAPQLHRI